MTKKILVISFSPRAGGNTDTLLERAAKGASDAGGDVEFARLRDLRVEPCRECLSCNGGGPCVINDDMRRLYPKLVAADRFVVGSPIFFMGVPAHAKAFIDRCQPFWVAKHILKKPLANRPERAKGVFIAVSGTRMDRVFDGAVKTVKALFAVLGIDYARDLLAAGIEGKGDILRHPDLLDKSYELGTLIATCGDGAEDKPPKRIPPC